MKKYVLKFSQLFESYEDRKEYYDRLWSKTEHGSMRGQEEYVSDADIWDSLKYDRQKYYFLLKKGIDGRDIQEWLNSDEPKDEWLDVKRYFGI